MSQDQSLGNPWKQGRKEEGKGTSFRRLSFYGRVFPNFRKKKKEDNNILSENELINLDAGL